jgi:hypothetical protein
MVCTKAKLPAFMLGYELVEGLKHERGESSILLPLDIGSGQASTSIRTGFFAYQDRLRPFDRLTTQGERQFLSLCIPL